MSLLVTRRARLELALSEDELPAIGRVMIDGSRAARVLSDALSRRGRPASGWVQASDLAALSVLDRIFRLFLDRYARGRGTGFWTRALARLEAELGPERLARALGRFADAFALTGPSDAAEVSALGAVDPEELLREVLLFWLQRSNRAAAPIVGALHSGFAPDEAFQDLLAGLERFLGECEGETEATLLDDLMAPLRASPESLAGQLAFLAARWGSFLGDELRRIQGVLDLSAEESKPRWDHAGSPPVEVGIGAEGERRYSDDRAWMPELVLVAKNALVWLDQLSRAYGREIRRLDQVPDAELELLAGRGLSGLWLIGLWERSVASAEIKRMRGNPEAAASAYSLQGYRIAAEIGGEEALADLRRRATRFGIHLAADMVPNHMGVDSDWVLDHPERFVQVSRSPFPAYSFTGPDFSPRPGITLQIEDHYFDGTDAAVVFRRHDHASGEERFIYHGNDGTSTPWNDTAQLDYLNESTREAVVATILDVARRFSVIRFDAAMTLAKRHYQRLWHPLPGDAGAIPSRAEHGMTRQEFDRAMPREFWRDVVDRVAREAPDTLLLAEAFWLMEGYFVRTLGMHRVYNSAFMHMLRDRETGKFRQLLKETLSFDPEILRRYVNFMSNPDEEPAVAQFGDGDRYFGVCVVLATLPGLPMFAHGQWDGLREKYGMEYRRAYHSEQPSRAVIARHDREIAPLLAERSRFAGVEDFRLYDFHDGSGHVNDNVLAYSNGRGRQAVLVVFNNSPSGVHGRLHDTTPMRSGGESGETVDERIGAVLGLDSEGEGLCRFRDRQRQLEYLQPVDRVVSQGLTVALDGFQAVVLDGFRLQADDEHGGWSLLADRLEGRGVESLDHELLVLGAAPLRQALERAAALVASLSGLERAPEEDRQALVDALDEAARRFAAVLTRPPLAWREVAPEPAFAGLAEGLATLACGPATGEASSAAGPAIASCRRALVDRAELRFAVLAALAVRSVADLSGRAIPPGLGEAMLATAPLDLEASEPTQRLLAAAVRLGWLEPRPAPASEELRAVARNWSSDADLRVVLGRHWAHDVEWLVREQLELLLDWRRLTAVLPWIDQTEGEDREPRDSALSGWGEALRDLGEAAERAGYSVEEWLVELGQQRPPAAR